LFLTVKLTQKQKEEHKKLAVAQEDFGVHVEHN
jgi:hypothetical protein